MAKSTKINKAPKQKTHLFFGFNLRLQSKLRRGEEAYIQLLQAVYNKQIVEKISSEKAMMMISQFTTDHYYKRKKHQVLHGNIVKFTELDDKNWFNKSTMDIESFNIPENIFPHGYKTEYIFIPAAHRFYIRFSPKIHPKAVQIFLNKALDKVISSEEITMVDIIQSQETFDEIIYSQALLGLRVVVSYSNDDIGDEVKEEMDQMLREGNIGKAETIFKPDHNATLNGDSKLVRGMLEVARENGEAEATIRSDSGRPRKIFTKNHPEKKRVSALESDDIYDVLFNEIMKENRDE